MEKKYSTLFNSTYSCGRQVYIYGLYDPCKYNLIRYVGKTVQDPHARWKSEIYEADSGHKCHRCDWIRSLKKFSEFPRFLIIEICDENNWIDRERYWIKHYRESGYDIVNHSDGGDGNSGYRHTSEAIEKIRFAGKRKKTKQHIAKLADSIRGKKHSKCRREKERASHMKFLERKRVARLQIAEVLKKVLHSRGF